MLVIAMKTSYPDPEREKLLSTRFLPKKTELTQIQDLMTACKVQLTSLSWQETAVNTIK